MTDQQAAQTDTGVREDGLEWILSTAKSLRNRAAETPEDFSGHAALDERAAGYIERYAALFVPIIADEPRLLMAAQCALGVLTGNMDGDWDLGDAIEMLRNAIAKAKAQPIPALRATTPATAGARDKAIIDLARELISPRGMVNRGVDRGLVVVEKADKSDPHYRLCTAIEEYDAAPPAQPAGGEIAELPNRTTVGHPDAYLAALLRYSGLFFGTAISSGVKPRDVVDAIQHVERAARGLHALALASPGGGSREEVGPDRQAIIEVVMRETTDKIVADGWEKLGAPNVLVQGCRYVRGPHGRGYEDPEDAARKFAGFIADALLASGTAVSGTREPHKIMTAEEYASRPLRGWHEVCRDWDGLGGTAIRYLGLSTPTDAQSGEEGQVRDV